VARDRQGAGSDWEFLAARPALAPVGGRPGGRSPNVPRMRGGHEILARRITGPPRSETRSPIAEGNADLSATLHKVLCSDTHFAWRGGGSPPA